jgi:hypothetical protein
MAKGFSLSEFFPEPMTFTDDGFGGNGKVHDVKTVELLGVQDSVRLQRLYDRLIGATASKKTSDEKLAVELEQTADEMMHLLIPTLPKERIGKMSFQAKFAFLRWWRSEQPKFEQKGDPVGEGEAGEAPAGA